MKQRLEEMTLRLSRATTPWADTFVQKARKDAERRMKQQTRPGQHKHKSAFYLAAGAVERGSRVSSVGGED